MSTRKPILIANWKLNHSKASATIYFKTLLSSLKRLDIIHNVDLVIAPVATLLDFAEQELKNSGVSVAAQDVFYEAKGAYTGEYSSENLRELGVKYAIVGHSERRRLFHGTIKMLQKKPRRVCEHRLFPYVVWERLYLSVKTVLCMMS